MATTTTKEVNIHDFQKEIFFANADLISPVVIQEQEKKDQYVLQTLTDVSKEMKRHSNWWSSYAGPAGIGQYSLTTGKPAGVLARVDSYFRTPSEREMKEDFQNFREQVIGPVVSEVPVEQKEQYENVGVFQCFDENFYFSGPPRLNKTVFLSRVFPGILPSDISKLINDIEGISESGKMIVTQGYRLFHAIDGKMSYLPFKEIAGYDPKKLTEFGQMRMERKRLLFYPTDTDEPVDFTQDLQESKN